MIPEYVPIDTGSMSIYAAIGLTLLAVAGCAAFKHFYHKNESFESKMSVQDRAINDLRVDIAAIKPDITNTNALVNKIDNKIDTTLADIIKLNQQAIILRMESK